MKHLSRRTFLKTSSIFSLGVLFSCGQAKKYDIILKGGTLFDGLGNPGLMTDLGIIDDKIIKIGNLATANAKEIIDVSGYYISPGFIDIHTHTDMELLVNPKGESKIHQGVTTEVSGNCGYSPFPLDKNDALKLYDSNKKKYGLSTEWKRIEGFFYQLKQKKIGLNYASFTGHGDLRAYVLGRDNIQPTKDQLAEMKTVLANSLKNGSIGLSTGLEYAPGSYAKTEELIELCKVVKQYNGIYATHLRSESVNVERAIKEALDIARESGVSLQISHFKACNRPNWHKLDNMLKLVHDAKQSGIDVMIDRYPYNAWGTGLSSFLPLWAREGATNEILARLKKKSSRKKIATYMNNRAKLIGGWDHVLISSCNNKENQKYQGKYVNEASEMAGQSPTNFVFELLIAEKNDVGVIGFAMSEDNLKKVLADPLTMIGSDGNAVAPYGQLNQGNPHPRYYGTFPRVLGKYCREEKLFDWPVAIKKMTSLPAKKLHLKNRGILKPGNYADITVFNPKTITDKATYVSPHQYAIGVEHVIINGQLVIKNGKHTNALPGKILTL